jgi:hypothetical protein
MEGNGGTKLGRRALLAAGAAGVAAAAAQAIAAPTKVLATDHQPVIQGETNLGTMVTIVTSSGSDALRAQSNVGDALVGWSTAPAKSGLYAHSGNATGYGVAARNDATLNIGNLAGPDHGAWAEGHKGGKAAVHGVHVVGGNNPGVAGVNSANNTWGILGGLIGVGAYAPNNLNALGVAGKATFSRSGVLTIPKNAQYAKVPDVALTSDSFIIATLNQYRSGVWIAAAIPNVASDSITIYLNKKATLATKVAWFVLEKFPAA